MPEALSQGPCACRASSPHRQQSGHMVELVFDCGAEHRHQILTQPGTQCVRAEGARGDAKQSEGGADSEPQPGHQLLLRRNQSARGPGAHPLDRDKDQGEGSVACRPGKTRERASYR